VLKRTEGWQIGDWAWYSMAKPSQLVEDFSVRVQDESELVALWAVIEGQELHFFSLINPDRGAERRMHKAELEFLDKWKHPPVQFHVYRDRKAVSARLGKVQPVLTI